MKNLALVILMAASLWGCATMESPYQMAPRVPTQISPTEWMGEIPVRWGNK